MIGGFVRPTSGRIRFGSEDVTDLPPNKRPCNTIFQDLGLFPHMTVAENVANGLRLRSVAPESRKKRVANMLAIVALDIACRPGGHRVGARSRRPAVDPAEGLRQPDLVAEMIGVLEFLEDLRASRRSTAPPCTQQAATAPSRADPRRPR
jgi:ABC-type molybdate transport system ATPase subunit